MLEDLAEGTLDTAFLRAGSAGTENFRTRTLSEDPMVVALPSAHPLARNSAVDLRMLAGESFILFPREMGPALYQTITDTFHTSGVQPNIDQTVPQITSIITLVSAELGYSIVPASMAAITMPGVSYLPIEGVTPQTNISLAWRKDDGNRIIRNFLACAT